MLYATPHNIIYTNIVNVCVKAAKKKIFIFLYIQHMRSDDDDIEVITLAQAKLINILRKIKIKKSRVT